MSPRSITACDPIRYELLFERFISEPSQAGEPINPLAMWLIIAGIGVVSMAGLSIYDRVLVKGRK